MCEASDLHGLDVLFLDQQVLVLAGLAAFDLVLFVEPLAALGIDILPFHRIAGGSVDDAERHFFALRGSVRQFDRAGHKRKLEVSLQAGRGAIVRYPDRRSAEVGKTKRARRLHVVFCDEAPACGLPARRACRRKGRSRQLLPASASRASFPR